MQILAAPQSQFAQEILEEDASMNAVAKLDPTTPPSFENLSPEDQAMMQLISAAVFNPEIGADKLHGLLDVRERLEDRTAERAYDVAMCDTQAEMEPVRKDASNPQTHSKYASGPALDRAVRPIYTKHGFSLSYDTEPSPLPDHVRLLCYVSHVGGHKVVRRADVPADGKGAKGGDVMTKTHALGSALTYGQRYLLQLIFNISRADDDGNGASSAREQPAVVNTALAAINACEGAPALLKWNADNRDFVLGLAAGHRAPIVALYKQRLKAAETKAAQSKGSK